MMSKSPAAEASTSPAAEASTSPAAGASARTAARVLGWASRVGANRPGRIYIVPTGMGAVLALMVTASFVVGGVSGHSSLLVLSGGLMVVGLVALLTTNQNLEGVRLATAMWAGGTSQGTGRLRLRLVNESTEDRGNLVIRCAGEVGRVGWLPPGGAEWVDIEVAGLDRGVYPVRRVLVSSSFPYGLCWAWKAGRAGVRIAIPPAPRGDLPIPGEAGRTKQAEPETIDLHAYSPGDPVFRIDWALFARSRDLYIRSSRKGTGGQSVLIRWEDTRGNDHDRLQQLAEWVDQLQREGAGISLLLPGLTRPVQGARHARESLAAFRDNTGRELLPGSAACPPTTPPRHFLRWLAAGFLALNSWALVAGQGGHIWLFALILPGSLLVSGLSRQSPAGIPSMVLAGLALQMGANGWGPFAKLAMVVAGAAFLMESQRPENFPSLRLRRVVRILRTAVPSSIIVWLALSFFHHSPGNTGRVGFSPGSIRPGSFESLARSTRVAFDAHFAHDPPTGLPLYWRCDILEKNSGLVWSRLAEQEASWSAPTASPAGDIDYELAGLDHSELPVLGIASPITDSPHLRLRGGLLRGIGSPERFAVSARPRDAHDPPGAFSLQVNDSKVLDRIADRIRSDSDGTSGSILAALDEYFADGGFRYSLSLARPATPGLEGFLIGSRTGYCGHYAAASADLLRRTGIPARVVTGYLGGEYNPLLKRLRVRESDAHAWVEVWDGNRWLTYDPTSLILPGGIADRSTLHQWNDAPPWHSVWAWADALPTWISEWFRAAGDHLVYFVPARSLLVAALLISGGVFVIKLVLARRTPRAKAIRSLQKLERLGRKCGSPRLSGETPLHFMKRLSESDHFPLTTHELNDLARHHDRAIYSR